MLNVSKPCPSTVLPLENLTLTSYRLITLMCGMALSLLHYIDIVQTLTGYTHIVYFNKFLSRGTSHQPLYRCMSKLPVLISLPDFEYLSASNMLMDDQI